MKESILEISILFFIRRCRLGDNKLYKQDRTVSFTMIKAMDMDLDEIDKTSSVILFMRLFHIHRLTIIFSYCTGPLCKTKYYINIKIITIVPIHLQL